MFKSRKTRFLAATGLAALLGVGVFAFAAANTVAESGAGDGSGVVSGYNITNIHYTLSGNNENIDVVEFDVAPLAGATAATAVSAGFDGAGLDDCTSPSAGHWVCDVAPNPTVASAASLRVVAVQ